MRPPLFAKPAATTLFKSVTRVVLGAALLFLWRWRVPLGLVVAVFFIAVFPGNVSQYLNHDSAFGLDTEAKRFARLFFQPMLVVWALWSTGAWAWLRSNRPHAREPRGIPV